MRAVVQRVSYSKVLIKDKNIGEINSGLNVLLGIEKNDSKDDMDYIANKVLGLRIFPDKEGKMNLSVLDVKGEILLVSQFTLCGDVRKGKRPSFIEAEEPETAKEIYLNLANELKRHGVSVKTGEFQADMDVIIHNQGPVTILLDSKKKF